VSAYYVSVLSLVREAVPGLDGAKRFSSALVCTESDERDDAQGARRALHVTVSLFLPIARYPFSAERCILIYSTAKITKSL
jgi:hypothetical protein